MPTGIMGPKFEEYYDPCRRTRHYRVESADGRSAFQWEMTDEQFVRNNMGVDIQPMTIYPQYYTSASSTAQPTITLPIRIQPTSTYGEAEPKEETPLEWLNR